MLRSRPAIDFKKYSIEKLKSFLADIEDQEKRLTTVASNQQENINTGIVSPHINESQGRVSYQLGGLSRYKQQIQLAIESKEQARADEKVIEAAPPMPI